MSWKYLNKQVIDRGRMYEIIRSPVITEKSTLGSETGNTRRDRGFVRSQSQIGQHLASKG